MLDAFTTGIIVPATGLAFLGWLVPRLLSLVWPEGVRPLLALAAISVLILLLLSMAAFALLYLWQGVPLASLVEPSPGAALWHFARLGGASILLWGPMLALSVAGLPKHWVRETW